ncbi:hypothetical protein AAFF_G00058400 [Aldrovandia affinis]|uniref:Uncharacterized protein n=1 Tax=Aldrovandia affinis TaxID=143900 RepID=A0AAD7S2M6_9TELE|nr:hypothetical protein AAFF_G00058400 [Aldrovandia affinis]
MVPDTEFLEGPLIIEQGRPQLSGLALTQFTTVITWTGFEQVKRGLANALHRVGRRLKGVKKRADTGVRHRISSRLKGVKAQLRRMGIPSPSWALHIFSQLLCATLTAKAPARPGPDTGGMYLECWDR